MPSVLVLPVDEAGRVLLVRHAGHDDGWGILGGAVEPGESPAAAAVREAREEIGVDVQLVSLLDVLGGPDYEVATTTSDAHDLPHPQFGKKSAEKLARYQRQMAQTEVLG